MWLISKCQVQGGGRGKRGKEARVGGKRGKIRLISESWEGRAYDQNGILLKEMVNLCPYSIKVWLRSASFGTWKGQKQQR